jgi:hypothetical protein
MFREQVSKGAGRLSPSRCARGGLELAVQLWAGNSGNPTADTRQHDNPNGAVIRVVNYFIIGHVGHHTTH